MKIALVLSIREKSTRLPGKVLKELQGQTVTEHLIDRLKMVKNADNIVIGTSDDPRDAVFGSTAKKKGIDVFFGDQDDKLLRYYQICNHFNMDGVIVVDGDDILCFPEIMEKNIELLKSGSNEVVFWRNLPLGAASSALTKKALEKVIELKAENDTEVWGGYFLNSDKFKVNIMESDESILNHPEIRMTLDYQEDFDFLTCIFNDLYLKNNNFSSTELMNYIVNDHPELIEMTNSAQLKYEEHIKKAKPVKFK
jgi:spore coat polysaccharide biosynthesis protein SpsF (cytidylyltransferase family)